ncbi:MAG: DUF420 domain-containing protein [Candidatus Omnitrophota bacterium]|nr:DUF420 domain-containing protein [Candidatus Omnitrophota bacterium]
MPELSRVLPAVNASLNALAAVLLVTGFLFIRRKNIPAHRACMTAAFTVSALFLVTYLTHHALHGSTRFPGTGPAKTLYFAILISHTMLAVTIPPLAIRTLYLARRDRILEHRRLARWTFPLWLYVSVTGVVVYWMLYQMKWN